MIAPKRSLFAILIALVFVGCHEGSGSDIGPKLPAGPKYDYRVLVHDDSGQPVVGAKISISGVATTATTSHTGRAFLLERAAGNHRVTIDGTNAAAADSSQLGVTTVAANLPDGDELPYVVYLPDHASSFGLTLNTGVQSATVVLTDDPTAAPANASRSGAVLTVNIGDNVTFSGAGMVELRSAKLSIGHLPSTLTNGGAVTLASRGIYVHPAGIAFQNGADLSIPDDLGLSASQSVNLYKLDPATGLWSIVGTATESSGRIAASALIKSGGLYSFGLPALMTTQITGLVVDLAGNAVLGALVRAPQASTRTGADGRFTLPLLARTNMQGADRSITVEVHGGRNYLPTKTSVSATLNASAVALSSVVLSTHLSTNVRLLLINRGEVVPNRRFRISGRLFLTDSEALIGANGIASLEEVGVDVTGYVTSVPNNIHSVFRTRSLLFLKVALDNATTIFSDEYGWRQSLAGGTLVESLDKFGTGAVFATHVVIGSVPGAGHVGQTDLNGFRGVNVPRGSIVTTVMKTDLDGKSIHSAFTMADAQDGRFEMPTERVRRRFGAFRRFGMVSGNLTGLASSNTRLVRGSGSMTRQDFYDQVLFGRTSARWAPVAVIAPPPAMPAFRVGVPSGLGHLAGAEGTTTGGVFVLERLGVVAVTAVEGGTVTQNIPLVAASTGFLIQNGVAGLDTSSPPVVLQFDLAGEQSSGLVADLVRGVGGASIVVVPGSDATLNLPPLPAGVARYIAVLRGTSVSGSVTRTQQIVADLDGVNVPDVAQLPLPVVSSPAALATVSRVGFTVNFTLPAACHYGVVQLRSDNGTNVRDWTVVVPRYATQANFFQFPTQVPDVLTGSRTWTLTVSAARIGSGLLRDLRLSYDETYLRVLSNWVGMPEADRQENSFSSVSFTVTTN